MIRVPACDRDFADSTEDEGLAIGVKGLGWVEIPDSGETLSRNEFQVNIIREVSQKEGFSHFCTNPFLGELYDGARRVRGTFILTWYENDDFNWMRVGQKRILQRGKGKIK